MTSEVSQTYKVALIQLCPKPLDPEHNFKEASQYIVEAAQAGASLAILPEYHLYGWDPVSEHFTPLASRAYEFVERYRSLARNLHINIVPGTIVQTAESAALSYPEDPAKWRNKAAAADLEQDSVCEAIQNDVGFSDKARERDEIDQSKSSLYNIAYFISSNGEILGSYTKKNIWHPERPYLTSLNHEISPPHTVIQTPLGPIGMLICWDLAFPEAFRCLVMQGAKIIIMPTFWLATDCSPDGLKYNPQAESLFLNSTLTARAFESTTAVVFCNAGGEVSEGYLGLSQVNLPLIGPAKGSFSDSRVGMQIVDLDMEVLEVAERNYKVRQDLARDDWHYGYNHEEHRSG